MKTLIAAILGLAMVTTIPAFADDDHDDDRRTCSTRMLAGKWLFATSVGRQAFSPGGDIMALGTMNINKAGELKGVFDVTIENDVFLPGIGYSGSVTVNRDCTGTLQFVTDLGTARTDSILVLNRKEVRAMSQDPGNLWTYEMRKISR